MSKQSRAEEEHQATVLNQPPPSTPPSEEPYSIFDKRQKAIIVLIASTAATCTSLKPDLTLPPSDTCSLWVRLQHLLSCHPNHRRRPARIRRSDQPDRHLLPHLSGFSTKSLGSDLGRQRTAGCVLLHLCRVSGCLHWAGPVKKLCSSCRSKMHTKHRQRFHYRDWIRGDR